MAKKDRKITLKTLDIAALNIDYSKNVRDPSRTTYDVAGLKADILQAGAVKVRPLVHFHDGQYDRILQGYRRATAVQELHKELPHDERWQKLEVEVVENLTEAEMIDAMVDHGNTKTLERHEVARAVWMILEAQPTITDDQLSVKVHGLLSLHFPAGGSLTDPKEIAKHYRGTIQNIRNGWRLPVIAQDVFMLKLKGDSAYPTKKEVSTMVKIFEDERKADATCQITKQNPGPVFIKKWEELVESHEASAESGTRQKAVSAFSRAEMTAAGENSPSQIVRGIAKLFCRDVADADKRLVSLGHFLLAKVENQFTPELKAEFIKVMSGEISYPVNPAELLADAAA